MSNMDPEEKAMFDIIMPFASREKLRGHDRKEVFTDIINIVKKSLDAVYHEERF